MNEILQNCHKIKRDIIIWQGHDSNLKYKDLSTTSKNKIKWNLIKKYILALN